MGASLNPSVVNKRGFPGKDATCVKNVVVAHRPITRSLAEKVVSNQHHISQDTKKLNIDAEDCTIIEVDVYEDAIDDPVPMFVRHTEAFLDEIDQMDVDKMEDDDEPIMDIDSCDLKNQLAVVEYINDIYAYYEGASVVHFQGADSSV